MNRFVFALLAGSASLLGAATAHATLITSAGGLTYGTNTATETLTNSTGSLTSLQFGIDQFDPTGHGTLTGLTITISDSGSIGTGYISNNSTSSSITGGSLSVSETGILSAVTPGLSGVGGVSGATDTYVATMGANGNLSTIAPAPSAGTSTNGYLTTYVDQTTGLPGSTLTIPITASFSIGLAGSGGLTLSQWSGTGQNTIGMTLLPSFTAANVAGSNSFGAGGSITNTQTVTVTYDYTAPVSNVPEPATVALLSSGLLGLGMVRYRRARK